MQADASAADHGDDVAGGTDPIKIKARPEHPGTVLRTAPTWTANDVGTTPRAVTFRRRTTAM
jgi:hypothetical protein